MAATFQSGKLRGEIVNADAVDILMVDDSQDDVDLALHALRRRNITSVFVTYDGEQALDFMFGCGEFSHRPKSHPPKLVLLDLKLPKIDGMQVLAKLKQDERTRQIPVVILTSSKEASDLLRGYNLGANSYIQKPVDFDQFREAVKTIGVYWLGINQIVRSDVGQFKAGEIRQ
jgi:CheY-like chemotaxis protein